MTLQPSATVFYITWNGSWQKGSSFSYGRPRGNRRWIIPPRAEVTLLRVSFRSWLSQPCMWTAYCDIRKLGGKDTFMRVLLLGWYSWGIYLWDIQKTHASFLCRTPYSRPGAMIGCSLLDRIIGIRFPAGERYILFTRPSPILAGGTASPYPVAAGRYFRARKEAGQNFTVRSPLSAVVKINGRVRHLDLTLIRAYGHFYIC
jgi:hypothetical protein